jgi:hypothetical protein
MWGLLFIFGILCALSLVVNRVARELARRMGLVDRPVGSVGLVISVAALASVWVKKRFDRDRVRAFRSACVYHSAGLRGLRAALGYGAGAFTGAVDFLSHPQNSSRGHIVK